MKAELLVKPGQFAGRVEDFGCQYLSFANLKLSSGDRHEAETGERELALVILGGRCSIGSSRGEWAGIGARASVFGGRPYTLYLPPHTRFTISTQDSRFGEQGCDLALCFSKAEEEHAPRLVRPEEVEVEIRGGGNATRQIHHMIRPDFPAHRLLVVEVYTPAGNWSSYPPHKHDVHNPPAEVDLEEIYYYRIRRPEGYAIQKIYTADRRIDATLTVRDGELVLVPEGYHPVVAAHGYDVYYLNALAGSARSMAASDDPDYAWVRGEWRERDPRLPLVP
jgi:5-deoxy-glucuronate isomerase